jgi:predicted ATPase
VPENLRNELGALLPELDASSSGAADRASLFSAVVNLLGLLSGQGALTLLLDDAQWFDEASVALLHYAARELADTPVVIACGARPGELEDNPAALRLVRALSREARLQELELAPLDAHASSELSRAIAPGVDVERVVRESAGNPLFVLELSRALSRGDAGWKSVGAMISDRLGRLEEGPRELVSWAAALGKSFELTTLEQVSAVPTLELLSRIAELERHGIVRVSSDGGYDFVHDLIRAGAYQRLSEPARRVVHRRIAHSLHALHPGGGALAGEIAHHAARGGDSQLAARLALVAAERSLRMWASVEAARLAELGLSHVGRLESPERIKVKLGLLRVEVEAHAAGRDHDRIRQELTRAVLEAEDAGLHDDAALGLQALSLVQWERGDVEAAHESTLRAADASKAADPLSHARQLGDTVRCLVNLERDVERAHAMFQEAQAIAERQGTELLAVEWAAGMLNRFTGDVAEAGRRFERGLVLARAVEDRWAEYSCQRALVELDLEAARYGSALERCSGLAEVASKLSEGSEVPAARSLEAIARISCGDQSARVELEESIEALRAVDAQGLLAYVLSCVAARDLEERRLDDAERRAVEAARAAEVVNRRSLVAFSRVLLGRIALLRGDAGRAEAELAVVRTELGQPFALNAYARSAWRELESALDEHV